MATLQQTKSKRKVSMSQSTFQIYHKNISGKTITLAVNGSSTISDIKEIVHSNEGISPDKIKVIYAGKLMEDDSTLDECNIQKESTIHLVFDLEKTEEQQREEE
eukprot:TRINITY_DN1696_c0_g1_i2.p1 TRINITY_DN1696_c0_g1~~TRINITY_DN1696_c0_g1_i2.p1  ORF type:complete len:104 (+),score=37.92 TRINITY_DN1696_c0_g1_i2:218-529(+)